VNANLLGTLLRAVNKCPTNAEIEAVKNANGIGGDFTFEQFKAAAGTSFDDANVTEEIIRESFRVFDKNGDNTLSATEIRHVMSTLGEPLSEEEIEALMSELSVNADGLVSLEAFVQRFTSRLTFW